MLHSLMLPTANYSSQDDYLELPHLSDILSTPPSETQIKFRATKQDSLEKIYEKNKQCNKLSPFNEKHTLLYNEDNRETPSSALLNYSDISISSAKEVSPYFMANRQTSKSPDAPLHYIHNQKRNCIFVVDESRTDISATDLPLKQNVKPSQILKDEFSQESHEKSGYLERNSSNSINQGKKQSKDKTNIKNIFHHRTSITPEHVCMKISDIQERCQTCYASLKQCFVNSKTAVSIAIPLQVYYMDYIQIFQKKMMLPKREKEGRFKKFFNPTNLMELRQLAFYILDRKSPLLGIEDFLEEEPLRIPKCILNYKEKVINLSFPSVQVMGDYECSNIQSCCIDKNNSQLMVLLKSDTNTKGCIHWFEFTVVAKKECTLTIVILNNQRNGFLYQQGMKIAVLDSLTEESETSSPWRRGGDNIYYYKSNIDNSYYKCSSDNNVNKEQQESNNKRETLISSLNNNNNNNQLTPKTTGYYTLEFSYKFTQPGQRVVFSQCFPYSFTDLCHFLEKIEKEMIQTHSKQSSSTEKSTVTPSRVNKQEKSDFVLKIDTEDIFYKRKIITVTRLGLPIYSLKITARKRTGPFKRRKRKVIFIIARQHPGETPSSFICQGLISFLLSDSLSAKILRSIYIFKIIPMMNPDGIVLGNTRCNLSGQDLNRKWATPDEKLTPEVYFTKLEVRKAQKKREILIFFDLHGHSQQMGYFLYGCDKFSDGQSWTKTRILPHILAKRSESFVLSQCKFKVTDDRASTARISVWRDMKISCSYTMETSFYGYMKEQDGQKVCIPFSVEDLLNIGKVLGNSLFENFVAFDKLQAELQESKGVLSSLPFQNQKYKKGFDDLIKKRSESFKKSKPIVQIIRKKSSSPPLDEGKSSKTFKPKCEQDLAAIEQIIKAACPEIENSWRDYFKVSDLEANFNLIAQGDDPNELESEDCGSDSEPEEDLYDGSDWPYLIKGKEKNNSQQNSRIIQNQRKSQFASSDKDKLPQLDLIQQKQESRYDESKSNMIVENERLSLPSPKKQNISARLQNKLEEEKKSQVLRKNLIHVNSSPPSNDQFDMEKTEKFVNQAFEGIKLKKYQYQQKQGVSPLPTIDLSQRYTYDEEERDQVESDINSYYNNKYLESNNVSRMTPQLELPVSFVFHEITKDISRGRSPLIAQAKSKQQILKQKFDQMNELKLIPQILQNRNYISGSQYFKGSSKIINASFSASKKNQSPTKPPGISPIQPTRHEAPSNLTPLKNQITPPSTSFVSYPLNQYVGLIKDQNVTNNQKEDLNKNQMLLKDKVKNIKYSRSSEMRNKYINGKIENNNLSINYENKYGFNQQCLATLNLQNENKDRSIHKEDTYEQNIGERQQIPVSLDIIVQRKRCSGISSLNRGQKM